MSLLWPDKIEKPLVAILEDIKTREPIILAKVEKLIDEARAEVAAWKAIRERLFHP
jgi:hypothetical protein